MLHGRMLRYLDVVARVGTIRKAAAQLHIASSAINRQIIALEEELGEPLFERMPRRMRLTAAGEVLIQHVRETLRAHEQTMQQIEAMKGLKRGAITLATTLGLSAGPMSQIISDYVDSYPRVRVRVSSAVTEGIANAVMNGEATLGLAYSIPPRPGLKTLFAVDLPLGAIVAAGHPLASRDRLRLSELLDYRLVIAEPGMSLRTVIDVAFSRFEAVAPVLETNSVELMRNFVAASDAVALLNPLDVVTELASQRLAFIPLDDENLHPQTLRLISRSNDPLDSIASHFAQHLIERVTALAGDVADARIG
ncbi:LysR family transcriptional regulator [Sphingobium sp. LMA1-1-1.1]|uniref:LysR family transcriptional regulator n=2 Tax=unclassified Sphingobium TaxID=2611147 RepID=UPI0034223A86